MEKIRIHVHVGNMLYYALQTYKNASGAVIELIQNAIDQSARHILIVIDTEQARLDCYDDGLGTTKEETRRLWSLVGTSVKKGNPDAGGQFGFGRFSGLGIAERWSMTTRPIQIETSHYFTAWIKRSELPENENPELSMRDHGRAHSISGGVNFIPTTQISLTKIDSSSMRELGDLEDIVADAESAWGEKIKRKKLDVRLTLKSNSGGRTLKVQPPEFPGVKNERVTITTSRGPIHFDFHVSLKPVPSAKILVIHRSQQQFHLNKMPLVWRRVRELLGSGHYQGYISLDFGTLRADREGLVRDEEESVFAQAIVKFVEEEVKPNFAELKSEHRLARYSQVIQEAVRRIDLFFERNRPFLLALKGKLAGFVSPNHTETEGAKETMHKHRIQPPTFRESKERAKTKKPTGESRGEQKNKIHSSVEHPHGRPRRIVKSQLGLTVTYEEASAESGSNWRTRVREGVIVFNTSHPDWINRDTKGPKALQTYVELNLAKEITTLAQNNDREGECFRRVFDGQFSKIINVIQET